MNNKLIAVAVVAMMLFAGFIVIAQNPASDAEGETGSISVPDFVSNGGTSTVTYTLSGADISGKTVTWSTVLADGTTSGSDIATITASSTTDENGKATATLTGVAAGTVYVKAEVDGVPDVISKAIVATADASTIVPASASLKVGQSTTVTFTMGTALAGKTVEWAVVGYDGSTPSTAARLSTYSSVTNSSGIATVTLEGVSSDVVKVAAKGTSVISDAISVDGASVTAPPDIAVGGTITATYDLGENVDLTVNWSVINAGDEDPSTAATLSSATSDATDGVATITLTGVTLNADFRVKATTTDPTTAVISNVIHVYSPEIIAPADVAIGGTVDIVFDLGAEIAGQTINWALYSDSSATSSYLNAEITASTVTNSVGKTTAQLQCLTTAAADDTIYVKGTVGETSVADISEVITVGYAQATAPVEIYADRTGQAVFQLKASPTDGIVKGKAVTWAVSSDSNLKFLVDGAEVSTATTTTDVFGKSYVTLVGVAAGSATVTATVASPSVDPTTSTITVLSLDEVKLATWEVGKATNFDAVQTVPVSAPVDDSSRMYVFQYTDATIMIDTHYMTNMSGVSNVYVGLTYSTQPEVLIGPLAAEEKIYVSLYGNYDTAANGSPTLVRLYSYDGSGTPYPLSASVSIAVVHDSAKNGYDLATLSFDPQYGNSVEGNHSVITDPLYEPLQYGTLDREEVITLSEELTTELLRDGFKLVAFSHNAVAVDGNNDGNGSMDIPLTSKRTSAGATIMYTDLTIEEILMIITEAAPAVALADDSPAYNLIQTDKDTKIYGVWQKKVYTITYLDPEPDDFAEVTVFMVNSSEDTEYDDVTTNYVADISGSTVIGGEETSFGIISIIKTGTYRDVDYVYKLKIMDEDGAQIVDYSYASAISTDACIVDMVNNGTWKIHHVTQNIKISAIANGCGLRCQLCQQRCDFR